MKFKRQTNITINHFNNKIIFTAKNMISNFCGYSSIKKKDI